MDGALGTGRALPVKRGVGGDRAVVGANMLRCLENGMIRTLLFKCTRLCINCFGS